MREREIERTRSTYRNRPSHLFQFHQIVPPAVRTIKLPAFLKCQTFSRQIVILETSCTRPPPLPVPIDLSFLMFLTPGKQPLPLLFQCHYRHKIDDVVQCKTHETKMFVPCTRTSKWCSILSLIDALVLFAKNAFYSNYRALLENKLMKPCCHGYTCDLLLARVMPFLETLSRRQQKAVAACVTICFRCRVACSWVAGFMCDFYRRWRRDIIFRRLHRLCKEGITRVAAA